MRRAQALLEDELLKEIFANAQKRAFEEFTSAKSFADAQPAWQTTQALDALRLEFAAIVGDGQRAEAEQKVEDRKAEQLARRANR
jgi:hypothetical protein